MPLEPLPIRIIIINHFILRNREGGPRKRNDASIRLSFPWPATFPLSFFFLVIRQICLTGTQRVFRAFRKYVSPLIYDFLEVAQINSRGGTRVRCAPEWQAVNQMGRFRFVVCPWGEALRLPVVRLNVESYWNTASRLRGGTNFPVIPVYSGKSYAFDSQGPRTRWYEENGPVGLTTTYSILFVLFLFSFLPSHRKITSCDERARYGLSDNAIGEAFERFSSAVAIKLPVGDIRNFVI